MFCLKGYILYLFIWRKTVNGDRLLPKEGSCANSGLMKCSLVSMLV